MKTLIALLAGVVLISGLAYYLLRTSDSVLATESEFALQVADRALVSGPSVMTVKRGSLVTIRITADEEEEYHLHGYDRAVDLMPGETATLTFRADTAGRFVSELEHSKVEIATLEVLP